MGTRLRKYFISGLVLFLPLALTVYLLALTINVADNFLGRFIAPYFLQEFGFYFKGLGIVICALLIFLIGFVVTNFIGRKLYVFFERLLLRLPFFKQVYPAIKDLAVFLFAKEHARFKQVVFIEYPRKGIYSVGFLTNDTPRKMSEKLARQEMCNVFMPSSPGPLTGFVLFVPKRDVIFSEMSIEQALKLIVSGGVVNPFEVYE